MRRSGPLLPSLLLALIPFATQAEGPSEVPTGVEHPLRSEVATALRGEMRVLTSRFRREVNVYVTGEADASAGLLLIHEWWGLNDNVRRVADRYAEAGYRVYAIDMYDGEIATDAERAGKLMVSVERRAAADMLDAALTALAAEIPERRIGVMGWCFGGGQALRASLTRPDLVDASVLYYGRMETRASRLEPLDMPVLGIFALQDSWITPEHAGDFAQAMADAGKSLELHLFDADHAFANPSGEDFDAEAAERARALTDRFLERHLRGSP